MRDKLHSLIKMLPLTHQLKVIQFFTFIKISKKKSQLRLDNCIRMSDDCLYCTTNITYAIYS